MWRFIGVLSLLLLPYASGGPEIEKGCPVNNVCLIYSKTSCNIGKAQIPQVKNHIGAVWPTTCDSTDYEQVWTFMKIEVISVEKYKFDIVSYGYIEGHKLKFIREDKDRNPISQSVFTFQKKGEEQYTTNLEYNYLDSSKEMKNGTLSMDMQNLQSIPLGLTDFWRKSLLRFSFVVHIEGVKLINLFKSDVIRLEAHGCKTSLLGTAICLNHYDADIDLRDDRFVPQLSELNQCAPSEISCFENNCGKLTFGNSSSTANCNATLRFWKPSESSAFTRTWTKFERIECEMASWRAIFDDERTGAVVLDSTYEVDCSEQEPANVTDYFKIVIGSIGGVVLLIFIVTIITVGFCARRLRRNRRNQLTLASMSAGSIAMTPTTRRASLKASETNRETNRDAVNI